MARKLLCLLIAGTLLAANQPIATVTAAQSVSVNGVDISTKGVPTWPLVSGDEVATGSQQAIVSRWDRTPARTLSDGSHFLMQPHTTLKISDAAGHIVMEVIQGSVGYQISSTSTVEMCLMGHPAELKPLSTGTASINGGGQPVVQTADLQTVEVGTGSCLVPTKRKSRKGILLIAGAAALGLALGLAFTLPSSASPSTPATP